MEKTNPVPTEKDNLAFNWSGLQPSHDMDDEINQDIERDDATPTVIEQAKSNGWECQYYSFGKLDGQGTEFFNPGIIERNDGLWLITRASGHHPQGFMYGQNSIIAFKLDDEGKQPHYGKVLKWPVENLQQHFEDPRGVYHPGLGQTLIGCCTFLWNGPGDWTGPHQAFGAFDDEWNCKKMDYPKIGGNPGSMEKITEHSKYEKNWLWFLHEQNLVLLYKANPWIVYIFGNRWSEKEEVRMEGVTWPYGEIRGGTTPVKVGDYYFTFHHSSLPWRGRYRRYYAGCLAFDAAPPFTPRLITAEPLLIGSQNDTWAQRKPLVVFPCGAVIKNDIWLVSLGVNDMVSAWLELPHKDLLKRMVPVEQVGDQIFSDYGLPEHKKLVNKHLSGENRRTRGSVDEVERPSALEGELVSHGEQSQSGIAIANESGEWTSADAQTSPARSSKKKRKPFSPETLEKMRALAAKARAARMAKRAEITQWEGGTDSPIYVDENGVERFKSGLGETKRELTPERRKKRRRKRFRRVTAKARLKALQDFEASKT